MSPLDWLYEVWYWRRERRDRERVRRDLAAFEARNRHFVCPHNDRLCDRYGCPDDPDWRGDRRIEP